MFGFTSESKSTQDGGGFLSPSRLRAAQQAGSTSPQAAVTSSTSTTQLNQSSSSALENSNMHSPIPSSYKDDRGGMDFREDVFDQQTGSTNTMEEYIRPRLGGDDIDQYEVSIPITAIILNTSFTPILVTNSNSSNPQLSNNNQQFLNISNSSNNSFGNTSNNSGVSETGASTILPESTSFNKKPRPQSAKFFNSNTSNPSNIILTMNPPTPPTGANQTNKLLAVSNLENLNESSSLFNNSGNSLLSSQNSACSGAHTTSSIISNKGSATGSGENGWTMTKQQRERFEHVQKLRTRLFDSIENINWFSEKASKYHQPNSEVKDTVEVKKQKLMVECVSKLIFLDEFYDALNRRVRSFDSIGDVVNALDGFCNALLNFSGKKFGYNRTSDLVSRKSFRFTSGMSNTAVNSKKSGSGNLLTGALSRDPSSEDMGGSYFLKDMSDSNINELVNSMEQNRLLPCFQHERLRDFIIGIWLELSKCENREDKLNNFLSTKVKRAVLDSERVSNTLVNSKRASTNLTSLLQSTEDSSLSLYNSSLVRKESVKTLEKILHIEENVGERISNDIRIITDMFLIELEDVFAVFHDRQGKFIKTWYNEALDRCLLPFHSLNAIKKKKESLRELKTDHNLAEDDFTLRSVIEKDWKFLDKLGEHTPDWKIISKDLPFVSAWSSNENYSNISDMRLTKFIGYFDYSIENTTRALCHDTSLEKIYNSKISWHDYNKPSMSSSLEKFPTAIMSCVNESSGLFKKQAMEMVISGKTKFIGSEATTELVESSFCFKSCHVLKNSKDSDSSRFISIGARYIKKVDNNRVRVMEVRFSRIVGFLKKTFLFSINMKKEMGLFYSSLLEIFANDEEKGFPMASTNNNLMKVICDYARIYCHVDFNLKYSKSEEDNLVI